MYLTSITTPVLAIIRGPQEYMQVVPLTLWSSSFLDFFHSGGLRALY